jgi:hypothetical protein
VSAYIVDHDHIDALLSYAIQHEVRYVANGCCVEISKTNATEIGRILLDENERSVRDRYPGCDADELPGTIGQNSACYKFRHWPARVPLPALTILKACDGFDYQACETDDYEQSLSAIIVRAIRGFAIRRLPGYSDSPGWSMSRPVKA